MDYQDGGSNLVFILLGLVAVFALISRSERTEPDLKHIPTLGSKGYLLSYIDAFRFIFTGPSLLRASYEQYRPGIYRIATLHRWLVVVTGTQHVEELRKFPEEELSFVGMANEADISLYHTGHGHIAASEDNGILTRYITQSLPFMLLDIRKEVSSVFAKFPTSSTGWTEIDPVDLVYQLMTAANNRVFLGSAFSRNAEFKDLSAVVARESFNSQFSILSNFFPRLDTSIMTFFSQSRRNKRHLRKLFMSLVGAQKASAVTQSPKTHTHNDIISWILNDESRKPTTTDRMVSHLFDLNTTATESLSLNFLHVLYYLSAHPKYAAPIRKEIESVVIREGWSLASLNKMHKLDSFVKESLRMGGVSSVSMMRKSRTDIHLSDGTHIPPGTILCAASRPRHLDASLYGAESTTFDGFRFSKVHEQHTEEYSDPRPTWFPGPATSTSSTASLSADGISANYSTGSGTRFQLVTTTTDYLPWGLGRSACPGRFYAAAVMKVVLAYVVVGYDVRFEDGVRPRDVCNGVKRLPNPNVKILLRKR